MSADYRVYAHISHQSRSVVASAYGFLAYTGAHQVENIYKDGLYLKPKLPNLLMMTNIC